MVRWTLFCRRCNFNRWVSATNSQTGQACNCIPNKSFVDGQLNVCSFVHQCNTFTFYFLLFVDMFRPHTAIFGCYSILSRGWCSVMPIFAYVMLPAMCFCWWCAYCQCPFVRIFVSLWPLKYNMVNLMLVLNHSFFNRGYIVMNALKAFASVQ
jgi:hypothetical protein